MARPKSALQRKTFAIRLPQEVINDSKSIPALRARLEAHAISIFKEWKHKELLLGEVKSDGK